MLDFVGGAVFSQKWGQQNILPQQFRNHSFDERCTSNGSSLRWEFILNQIFLWRKKQTPCKIGDSHWLLFSIHFILHWISCLCQRLLYLVLMISNARGSTGHRIFLIHWTQSGSCHLIDTLPSCLPLPPTMMSIYCRFHHLKQIVSFWLFTWLPWGHGIKCYYQFVLKHLMTRQKMKKGLRHKQVKQSFKNMQTYWHIKNFSLTPWHSLEQLLPAKTWSDHSPNNTISLSHCVLEVSRYSSLFLQFIGVLGHSTTHIS